MLAPENLDFLKDLIARENHLWKLSNRKSITRLSTNCSHNLHLWIKSHERDDLIRQDSSSFFIPLKIKLILLFSKFSSCPKNMNKIIPCNYHRVKIETQHPSYFRKLDEVERSKQVKVFILRHKLESG